MTPCPFCGLASATPAVRWAYPGDITASVAYIRCTVCDAEGPTILVDKYESRDAATEAAWKAWNTRPEGGAT